MPEGLTVDEVQTLHDDQIALYGGSPGLRDVGLLESALAQPVQELFGQFRYGDTPTQAAAYLHYVSQAHAFLDGNKRTALTCALVWLALHDLRLDATEDELFELTLKVAQGQVPLEQSAQFFADRAVSLAR